MGYVYRFGVFLKDFGERSAHKKRFYAGAFIRFGCSLRDAAARRIRA